MRADRLLSLMLLLQKNGKMTSRALADELGVSQRTIWRDVEALSLAGVPIYAEGGHGGGIALDEGYRTSLTGLKESEALTLFVSSNAKLLNDVGLGEAAERSLLKLLAALPSAHQPAVAHMRQRLLIDPDWWWQDDNPLPFWEALQHAVYTDHQVEAVYETYHGDVIQRILEPYSLIAKSSVWYLVAHHGEGEFRTYRVSRFRKIIPLDVPFQRREDFDLPTYWETHQRLYPQNFTAYAFTLRMHKDKLPFVNGLVPGRYQIKPGEEHWLVVQFYLESIEMAKMLVFGLGAQASVIEPEALRQAVVNAAYILIEQHRRAPPNDGIL
jgi:predicted DNA-binding transcriptional regulator YafY